MTTIVYTEEVMTTNSPSSSPRNIQKFTVKIMEGGGNGTGPKANANSSGRTRRAGSPKPQKKYSIRKSMGQKKTSQIEVVRGGHFPGGYNPQIFTITAYLPHDGGKRLKLHCTPGMTVQEVIETEIPDLFQQGYQVFQFPSRALLNPEKDASVLHDQEISIEPMKLIGSDEMSDERLALVRELLRSEDSYLENLKNIFDIYMEPLRKWGLPQSEMNILFRSLSRLCDLLMNFFSELELSVQFWNTISTQIGGLFKQYASFWAMYDEYCSSYSEACKLLKEKRMMDESFNRFLEMKRGAAMHTLESLMLLPVQRIYDYHRFLSQLYYCTPKVHPDYQDLQYAVDCVSRMVQDREHQLNRNQNDAKLEQVQRRFPNDHLKLTEPLQASEAMYKRTIKGYGSPAVSSKSLAHAKKLSAIEPPEPNHTDGGKTRLYLQEGPVKLITQGLQTHDRYFFLFDDLLLIAKPTGRQKSQHKSYKLKQRICLSEMWVADCLEEVAAASLPLSTTFLVGWPITNCIAAFQTVRERELWKNLLSNHIDSQRHSLQTNMVSICIVNLTKSSNNVPAFLQVHASETAVQVLLRALEQLAIAVSGSHCQLWVKYSKEESSIPLLGHEHPFAIQAHHNRYQVDYVGDSVNRLPQLQFVIKRKATLSTDVTPTHGPRLRRIKTPSLLSWYRGRRQSRYTAPSPGSSRRRGKKAALFAVPLNEVIINDQLPEVLQEMLIRLFSEGPNTLGIFRQSANHRKVKEMKEAIDNREQVDISGCAIHVVGALLKELLRSVPGGMMTSSRYTEFVATNDVKDDIPTRVQHIQKILCKIPPENQLFLHYVMPLLHHISTKEEINCMNSINLAICFAPSLLWPDSGLDVIKNEVPPLVQFMVEHCPKIFGEELPELYKQVALPSSPGVDNMEFSLEREVHYVPTKKGDDTPQFHHKRSESMETYSSEDSQDEDPISNLRRVRNSGLTFSDSQLSTISQLDDYELDVKSSRRYGAVGTVQLMGRMIAKQARETEMEPLSPLKQLPSAKRVKRSHRPERSHSYRSANEKPRHIRTRYRDTADDISRRKSIATQTTLPRKREFVPEFQPVPPSPNSSFSSSSQGVSPLVQPRHKMSTDEDSDVYPFKGGDGESHPARRHSQKRKSAAPVQYSHSFSKSSDNKPQKPISTSTSFYDKLLPRDQDSARIRSRSMNITHVTSLRQPPHGSPEDLAHAEPATANMTWPADQKEQQHLLQDPLMSQIRKGSSQSIASMQSGSSASSQTLHSYPGLSPHTTPIHRPDTLSHASNHSGESGSSVNNARPSSDPLTDLEQAPPINREFIKVAISNRYQLTSTGADWQGGQGPPPMETEAHLSSAPYTGRSASFTTSTPYSRPGYGQSGRTYKRSESFQNEVSMESVQRKLHERKPLDHGSAAGTTTPTGPTRQQYHSFHPMQRQPGQRKREDSLDVVLESLDDRPESEQHLNSLPRVHPAVQQQQQRQPLRHRSPPTLHTSTPGNHTFVPISQEVVTRLPSRVQPFASAPPHHAGHAPPLHASHAPPLHAGVYVSDEVDPNRLYPGYNSDTESSPSRTLNRPEKLKEVSNQGMIMPPSNSIPQRYHKTLSAHPVHLLGTTAATPAELAKRQQQQYHRASQPAPISSGSLSSYDTLEPLLPTQTLKAAAHLKPAPKQSVEAMQEEAVVSATQQKSTSKVVGVGQSRQEKSPEEKRADSFEREREERQRERAREPKASPNRIRSRTVHGDGRRPSAAKASELSEAADIEQAKVKLGLIPARQRSRSTSEADAIKLIQRSLEEANDECSPASQPSTADDTRTDKHTAWLSCVPSSHERRKAWESLSKNAPAPDKEVRSRSVKPDPNVVPPPKTSPSTNKSSTMPEYLASRGPPRRGMVRTVKIACHDLPKPQKIRRINLRAYY